MAAQLPNFDTLAEGMRTSATGLANAATEMERMRNIPVVDIAAQMNQILVELRDIRTEVGGIRTEVRTLRGDFNREYDNIIRSVHLSKDVYTDTRTGVETISPG